MPRRGPRRRTAPGAGPSGGAMRRDRRTPAVTAGWFVTGNHKTVAGPYGRWPLGRGSMSRRSPVRGADGAGPSGPRKPDSDPDAADRMGQAADSAPSAPGQARPPQDQVTPDPARQAHPGTEPGQGDAAGEPGGTRTRRLPAWITSAQQHKQRLRRLSGEARAAPAGGVRAAVLAAVQQDRRQAPGPGDLREPVRRGDPAADHRLRVPGGLQPASQRRRPGRRRICI